MAGYTEKHPVTEGTILVSIGDWGEGSQPSDRTAVLVKVRKPKGQFEVMVGDPVGCPWGDVDVFGPIQTRSAALARPDISDYFHVVDHVLAVDERFTKYFG